MGTFFRHQQIQPSTAPTVGGTGRWPLPKKGTLTGLLLQIDASEMSGAQLAKSKWRVIDYLDEIKILANGSYDIKNINGRMTNVEQWFELKRGDLSWNRSYASGTNRAVIPILLGRKFYDHTYGLDLSRFDDVVLEVKNDASATYWSGVSSKIIACYREVSGGPGPTQGYVRTRKWREYTTVQNGYEPVDLPSQDDILRVMVQSDPQEDTESIPDTDHYNLAYDLDYRINSGKTILFNNRAYDLGVLNALQVEAELLWSGAKDTTADYGIRTGTGRHIGWSASPCSNSGGVASVVPTLSDQPGTYVKPEAREADVPIMVMTRGFMPERVSAFLHDRAPDMSDILKPQKANDGIVTLEIHTRDAATAANGINRVFVAEFVRQ